MVKKCTKRKINFVSTAKWENEELSFPPLQSVQSTTADAVESLDFERIAIERSLKSAADANENKSVLQTIENRSTTFINDMKSSEVLENQSLNTPNHGNKKNVPAEEKDILSKSNLTFHNERKDSGSFEKITVGNMKPHFDNHKDRNSKSVNKSKNLKSSKNKQKNESQKKSKVSLQHSSPPKKKSNDHFDDLNLNKTSIEMNKSAKSENGGKNANETESEELSTFASDIMFDNLQKSGKIEHLIDESNESFTDLDRIILNSMNKCYTVFERSTSRYNFVKDCENQESEEKRNQCQKFTNLIQSFLEEENPLSQSSEQKTKQSEGQPAKGFRLFDQSYTLTLAKKTS